MYTWKSSFQTTVPEYEFLLENADIAYGILENLICSELREGQFELQTRSSCIRLRPLGYVNESDGTKSFQVDAALESGLVQENWRIKLRLQETDSGLLLYGEIVPNSIARCTISLFGSQSAWEECLAKIFYQIGEAAELLNQSPLAQKEMLTKRDDGRLKRFLGATATDNEISEGSCGILSVLDSGNNLTIRIQTAVPHPRRSQEIATFAKENRDALLSEIAKLAQAGSAFTMLRGEAEIRKSGRDLYSRMVGLGQLLYEMAIPKEIHGFLVSLLDSRPTAPLNIEADTTLQALPWELLHNGEDFLALTLPVSRIPIRSIERTKSITDVKRVLLAVPEDDLQYAIDEVRAIHKVLADKQSTQVEILSGANFTKQNLQEALLDGNFDVFHYCGHAVHDEEIGSASYLMLNDGRKLRADELRRITSKSSLKIIFLNSCNSSSSGIASSQHITGLANGLVQNGIPCVIGMRWPISDRGAHIMGRSFYGSLAKNMHPATAIREARLAVGSELDWEDPAWAAPVLYLA